MMCGGINRTGMFHTNRAKAHFPSPSLAAVCDCPCSSPRWSFTATPCSSSPCLTTTRERVPATTTDVKGTAIFSVPACFGNLWTAASQSLDIPMAVPHAAPTAPPYAIASLLSVRVPDALRFS